jgi:hypothetical protein
MGETTPYVTVSAVIRIRVHDPAISAFTAAISVFTTRDPGVHHAAIPVFTTPISAFTMPRSRRSRCRDPGVHDAAISVFTIVRNPQTCLPSRACACRQAIVPRQAAMASAIARPRLVFEGHDRAQACRR